MVDDPLSRPAPGWLSPGTRIYAIGDVHGCDDRLATLHRMVAADLAARPVAQPLLLHVGDYIDRGPDSAGVVRRVAAGACVPGCPTVCLRGNHEQLMLDALTGQADAVGDWLRNGAVPTLHSWGTDEWAGPAAWRAALAGELAFLQALPLLHAVDGYVFVHAGLRPGVRLAKQSAHDKLWIREGFLDWTGAVLPESPGMAVVHGHTPAKRPEVSGQRIGIDTGAVAGGTLTCAILEGRTVRFMGA